MRSYSLGLPVHFHVDDDEVTIEVDYADFVHAFEGAMDQSEVNEALAALDLTRVDYVLPVESTIKFRLRPERHEQPAEDDDTQAFLAQNNLCAETLTADEVRPYASWYAGGLFVLLADQRTDDGFSIKMHDSWDSHDEVVVHKAHLEDPDKDDLQFFATGREAFDAFIALVERDQSGA